MLPFEWRSVLSIIETDNAGQPFEVKLGTEQDREIRVNDYFKYKGYRFFQTNAIPEDPTYSGIGVVYDPGIPIVLVGMYTIIAGTVIAFLLRPVVLASRKRAQP
jgi:cytochrome c biogenesis protein ResB